MALELYGNGTRPGGMSRAGHRNARDHRAAIQNDMNPRDLKVASIRMDRRATRNAVRSAVADYQVGDGE